MQHRGRKVGRALAGLLSRERERERKKERERCFTERKSIAVEKFRSSKRSIVFGPVEGRKERKKEEKKGAFRVVNVKVTIRSTPF